MERTLSSGSHARSRPTRKLNARNSTTSSAVVTRNQRAVSAMPPATALLLTLGAAGRFGPPVPLEVADDPVRPPRDALVVDAFAPLLRLHQPGPPQDLHVVADGGLGDPEVAHDVAGADSPLGPQAVGDGVPEELQDGEPDRVGQGLEGEERFFGGIHGPRVAYI